MMPKRIGYKISTIFLFARVGDKLTKNWYNALQKSNIRTRHVRYTSHRQVLDYARNVGAEVNFLTMYTFLR